jgi:RNA polymerase sigma-70 factor (ECF subfamily)
MPAADSDEALMLAYRDGDAGAFETLYSRHRGGLYRFVLRQCGSRSLADELFQDVWMNLIAARSRYVPSAKFSTFLYQVARNRVIDHFRASGRSLEQPENEDDPLDPPAPPESQPEQTVERRETASRLLAALEALPPLQREAFLLHEEGELTLEEIAQLTGVGRETVKSRLRYALARLREKLEAEQ